MNLHPDEQSALELIAAKLRAAEPHLAAMLGIFTRLTAQEGIPPDEDRIGPARPAGRRRTAARSSPAPQPELWSSLRVILIPAALLMTLVLVAAVHLSGRGPCTPPDRAAVFAYHSAAVSACERAETRTIGNNR